VETENAEPLTAQPGVVDMSLVSSVDMSTARSSCFTAEYQHVVYELCVICCEDWSEVC